MNFRRLLFVLVVPMLAFSLTALAQDKVVTGKVTDAKDGSALPGATVKAKGTSNATQSDNSGVFKIKVPSTATTLVISYSGFATQEVAITGNNLNVSLTATNASLNEVIVVAYGTRRKADLTGAVTSVGAKEFQQGNIASAEQLLQGKVSGLQVTTGGGSAGGGSKIRIRGGASLNSSNDPLIVIDDVPVEGNGLPGSGNLLNTINPDDIESMSILKDASATALYGSRASNGVIIITTKKGRKGKPKFNFNTKLSLATMTKKIAVLTADEIASVITADAAETGNNTYKNLLTGEKTDWQNQIFQSAMATDNNLSVSGSYKNIPYRFSIGYLNQSGILVTNNFNRTSAALNLSPKLFKDNLSINFNFKYSNTHNTWADEGAIGAAASFDPTKPVTGLSKWGGYYEWLDYSSTPAVPIDLATRNPLALLKLRDNTSSVNRIISNLKLDYKLPFLPDLHLQANAGIDDAQGSGNDNYSPESATNYKTLGRYSYYKQGKTNTVLDLGLFYAKELKSIRSKIDVLVTHSYQEFVTNVYNYASYGQTGVLIPGTTPTYPTDKIQVGLESYLARVNYTLADKYLLTASVRRDATSRFSKDNRTGYFPAVALAWKLKDDFFKNNNKVNELKLRIGVGETGQQNVNGNGGSFNPSYAYLPVYSQSNSTAQYQFGNTFYSFLRPSAYDKSIKWESTTTYNLGLDFGFLQNRVSGSVELYFKKTKDLISSVPAAPGSNFDIQIVTNVGNMENKGVEFNINTVPVKTTKLTWDLGFNVTYNKSEITNLLKQQDASFKGIDVSTISGGTGNKIGKFAVGYAPYIYNVYKQVYDKNTGKPIEGLYEDLNRDGQITDADRYYYAKPAPTIMLGINTQVVINKLSIGLSGHSYLDNYLYNNYFSNNGVLRTIKNPINFIGNASRNYLETRFKNNQYLSDYYIENASFFRLDNINFGYNYGKVFNNRATLRVTANIQNVFVITKYKGLDPENSSDTGVDNNIYPRPRVFSLGASFDF